MRLSYSIIVIILALIFIFPLVNADYQTQKILTNYTLIFTADNATSCTFTNIQYADHTISINYNLPMSQNGQIFSLLIDDGNFSKSGITCMFYTCLNPSATPNTASGNTCVNVTPSGDTINLPQVFIYLLFLSMCLFIIYYSYLLIKININKKDELSDVKKYEMKSINNLGYYLMMLKSKLWIVGVFGIYIFIFIFSTILNSVVLDFGLTELNILLSNFNLILAWGFIPFIIFWIGYTIITIYLATERILRHQFGVGRER